MKNKEIIKIIEHSNIPAEQKAELKKRLKCNDTRDAILTILKFLDISVEIISLLEKYR